MLPCLAQVTNNIVYGLSFQLNGDACVLNRFFFLMRHPLKIGYDLYLTQNVFSSSNIFVMLNDDQIFMLISFLLVYVI